MWLSPVCMVTLSFEKSISEHQQKHLNRNITVTTDTEKKSVNKLQQLLMIFKKETSEKAKLSIAANSLT